MHVICFSEETTDAVFVLILSNVIRIFDILRC